MANRASQIVTLIIFLIALMSRSQQIIFFIVPCERPIVKKAKSKAPNSRIFLKRLIGQLGSVLTLRALFYNRQNGGSLTFMNYARARAFLVT